MQWGIESLYIKYLSNLKYFIYSSIWYLICSLYLALVLLFWNFSKIFNLRHSKELFLFLIGWNFMENPSLVNTDLLSQFSLRMLYIMNILKHNYELVRFFLHGVVPAKTYHLSLMGRNQNVRKRRCYYAQHKFWYSLCLLYLYISVFFLSTDRSIFLADRSINRSKFL